jgi:hypothetical protein
VRGGALALLLLAFGCSHNNERPKGTVGAEPTPFVIQNGSGGGGSTVASASGGREANENQQPTAATSAETEKEHKRCEVDQDCEGRLRCVAYRGVTGRELRQCLFSCMDGCPADYVCQMHVADGPSNACERTR